MKRHSSWHKDVPEVLTEKPPVWPGPKPTGKDARWPEFKRKRDASRQAALEALREKFNISYPVASKEFYADLAVHLLDLFPRFQTVAETRGRKRQKVVDPESLQRRVKRDRKTAKSK